MLCLGMKRTIRSSLFYWLNCSVLSWSMALWGSRKTYFSFLSVLVSAALRKVFRDLKKNKTKKTTHTHTQTFLRTNVYKCVWKLNITDSSWLPRDGTRYSLYNVVILSLFRGSEILSWNGSVHLQIRPGSPVPGNTGKFALKKVFLIRSEIMVMKEEAGN